MANHLWMLPWLALVAGFLVVALSLLRAGIRSWPFRLSPGSMPSLVLWLIVGAGLVLVDLRLGKEIGADVIPARGALLGLIGGLLLACWPARGHSAPDDLNIPWHADLYRAPVLVGTATLMAAAGSLWFRSAEAAGLIAMPIGALISVACLGGIEVIEPQEESAGRQRISAAVLGLLFLVSLCLAVAIGFSRADALNRAGWAYLPFLIAGGLAVGLFFGAELGRADHPGSLISLFPTVLVGAIVLTALCRYFVGSWKPAELVGMGFLVFSVLALLSALAEWRRLALRPGSEDLGAIVGLGLLLASVVLSFATWAGYGVGLLVLGGWWYVGWGLMQRRVEPDGESKESISADAAGLGGETGDLALGYAMAFLTMLMVYRILVLQSGPGIRVNGPGAIWDLFSIGVGALLPAAIGAWSRQYGTRGAPAWLGAVEWLIAIAAVVAVTDYVWATRSLAGVAVGMALSLLLSAAGAQRRSPFAASTLGAVLVGLSLAHFVPMLQHLGPPTRSGRAAAVLLCAVLAVVRMLVGSFVASRKPRITSESGA